MSQPGWKIATAAIGGTRASGGPKKGTSIASAEAAPMKKPYGRSSRTTTATVSAGLDGGQDELGAQEPAERVRHRALEDLELVGVAGRHHPFHLRDDPGAVGEQVEAEDDDEDEGAEDVDGHRRHVTEHRSRRARHGRLHVAVELHEVDVERCRGDRVVPRAQRALDPRLRQRVVGRHLPHVRAEDADRVEEQEARADERRGVDDADRHAARPAEPIA